MSIIYDKIEQIKVERVAPFSVAFTCPQGHRNIKQFKKTSYTERGIDFLVQIWTNDGIRYTCPICNSVFENIEDLNV